MQLLRSSRAQRPVKSARSQKNAVSVAWRGKLALSAAGTVAGGRGRSKSAPVFALGFDFGDGGGAPPAPKPSVRVGALQLRAASLLVFQSVLKGAVGEAFLAALAATQKYQAKNSEIVGAYARLYQLLLTAGHETWQDYVLDQVLFARDNALARAAAQGAPVERGAGALEAVAYDLDTLQDLALPLSAVLDLVADAAPTAGNYWLSAAGAPSLRNSGNSEDAKRLAGSAAAPAAPAAAIELGSGGGGGGGGSISFIAAPPSADELAQWKAAIAGHERWGAAAPLVLEYWRRHGFGVTSRNAALRWSKGAFEDAPEGAEGAPRAPLAGANATQRAALDDNTRRHARGLPAHHAVVCGPPGSGKSWMLWEGTLKAGRELGVRVVDVPSSEFGNVLDIARGCARYPRVRFILVADHVELPLRGSTLADVCASLGGAGGAGWPANALLYVGASAASAVSPSDAAVQRAGLLVVTEAVDEAGFGRAVAELLAAYRSGDVVPTGAQLAALGGSGGGMPAAAPASVKTEGAAPAPPLSSDELAAAVAWAQRHCGGVSLRAAAQCARAMHAGGGAALA